MILPLKISLTVHSLILTFCFLFLIHTLLFQVMRPYILTGLFPLLLLCSQLDA